MATLSKQSNMILVQLMEMNYYMSFLEPKKEEGSKVKEHLESKGVKFHSIKGEVS